MTKIGHDWRYAVEMAPDVTSLTETVTPKAYVSHGMKADEGRARTGNVG